MVAEKTTKLEQACQKLAHPPKLLIIRDTDNPVIVKYVNLKQKFGAKLGITVEDFLAKNSADINTKISDTHSHQFTKSSAIIAQKITAANQDPTINGLILQLPIENPEDTDSLCELIAPEKDVDGLNPSGHQFLPATVKAILDLLDFYNIDLASHSIAVVGRGKLVGAPLLRELKNRDLKTTLFHRGSDLSKLKNFDLIITATGVPGLIKSDFIAPNSVLVDAGTASEKGILKGDLDPELYNRPDLAAITPRIGGVGPATVACLFENLLKTTK